MYVIIFLMKKICFTGYRPAKMPFKISPEDEGYLRFYNRAKKLISAQIELGNSYFICGMAQGADLILAEIVLEIKNGREGVFLECALPFYGQCDKWPQKYKDAYKSVLSRCDKITVIGGGYALRSFFDRNKYMVDSCDIVVAVYDGKKGGTKFTCDYARKKGREVIILSPADGNAYFQQTI